MTPEQVDVIAELQAHDERLAALEAQAAHTQATVELLRREGLRVAIQLGALIPVLTELVSRAVAALD